MRSYDPLDVFGSDNLTKMCPRRPSCLPVLAEIRMASVSYSRADVGVGGVLPTSRVRGGLLCTLARTHVHTDTHASAHKGLWNGL